MNKTSNGKVQKDYSFTQCDDFEIHGGYYLCCPICGISSFAHFHQAGTLPKDFERIEKPPQQEKYYCSKHGLKHGKKYKSCQPPKVDKVFQIWITEHDKEVIEKYQKELKEDLLHMKEDDRKEITKWLISKDYTRGYNRALEDICDFIL